MQFNGWLSIQAATHSMWIKCRINTCFLCRIVELNTMNSVKNACMSFPVQNVWKAGIPLAVHGVVYNPADGKLKVQTTVC